MSCWDGFKSGQPNTCNPKHQSTWSINVWEIFYYPVIHSHKPNEYDMSVYCCYYAEAEMGHMYEIISLQVKRNVNMGRGTPNLTE